MDGCIEDSMHLRRISKVRILVCSANDRQAKQRVEPLFPTEVVSIEKDGKYRALLPVKVIPERPQSTSDIDNTEDLLRNARGHRFIYSLPIHGVLNMPKTR